MKAAQSTLVIALLGGCASAPSQEPLPITAPKTVEVPLNVAPALPAEPPEVPADLARKQTALLAKEIQEADSGLEEVPVPQKKQKKQVTKLERVPVEVNAKVIRWIHYFSVREKERFGRYMRRGSRYKSLVARVFKKYGVPLDLYYLGMIESGFHIAARSHAGAVGPWQFIRSTGRMYRLRSNYWIDERRDIVRATHAAAKHLRDLHKLFGSWHLALAAYNAGPARIKRAIRRGGTRDFWELARKRKLPRETRNYIPMFLAAITIGRQPKRFGFHNIESSFVIPKLKAVRVPGGVKLTDIARVSGLDVKTLRRYNAHIRRGITPPYAKGYAVWVPVARARRLARKQAYLNDRRVNLAHYRVVDRTVHRRAAPKGRHRVRRGQNLTSIARRYGTNATRLRRINGLRSSRIYAGQRLKVPRSRRYWVKQGDNLQKIARRFGVPIRALKRWNGLRASRIYAGQTLRVSRGG